MKDAKAFAAHVGEIVRDYLGRQLAPVLERVAALEARTPQRGEPGERGEAGPPGASITGERGADGKDGRDGIDGKDGAPGKDGRDGIDGAPGERGEAGAAGRDGLDGKAGERGADGVNGRDGLHGRDGTPGRDGKDGAPGVNGADGLGFDDLSVAYDGERTLTLRFQRGERVREFPIVLPVPLDRGVWRAGEAHARGDGVSHGGSFWIAQRDTTAKPGDGEDWRLATKKGRDGKDGERGAKGDTGAAGRAGRDLTNMAADGSRYA